MNLDLSGLDELAAGGLFAPPAPNQVRELPLDAIDFDPDQPRGRIEETALAELAASIRAHGVLQAICVRPNPQAEGRYLVSFGERRVRAARLAQRHTIPAVIEPTHDPYQPVIENLQREALSPLDLARFIARREQAGETRAAIARQLGKPRSFISEIAPLLQAPAEVRALCETGRCSDVRTLYALARGCRDNAPGLAPLLAGEAPITRAAAEAAAKGPTAVGPRPKRRGVAAPEHAKPDTLRVALDGRSGTLEWRQSPSPTSAWVRFEDGKSELVQLEWLRLVAWAGED